MDKDHSILYIVRHGQTDWNVQRLIQGQTDVPLNKTGEVQAGKLSEKLRGINFDAAFSSDLSRAKKTAEIITMEKKIAVSTTNALRERYFGKFQGHSFGNNKNIAKMIDNLKKLDKDSEGEIENDEALMGRFITFLREVAVAYIGKTVLVVTHAGVMRTFLVRLGWGTEDAIKEGHIDNLAFIKLESDGVDFFVRETSGIRQAE